MTNKLISASAVLLAIVAGTRISPAATTATSSSSSVDAINGWALAAETRFGSNGNANDPDLDYDLIDPNWNGDGDYIQWANNRNPYAAFDSGRCCAVLTANLNAGTATLTVEDSSGNCYVANYSGLTGTIKNIMIVSAVQTTGRAQWVGTRVAFYKGSTQKESTFVTAPDANTTTSSNTSAESMTLITPADSDDDVVVVGGDFEFSAPNFFLAPDDLFTQMLVFTN